LSNNKPKQTIGRARLFDGGDPMKNMSVLVLMFLLLVVKLILQIV